MTKRTVKVTMGAYSKDIMERLSQIPELTTTTHRSIEEGANVIEAVAFLQNVPFASNLVDCSNIVSKILLNWGPSLPQKEMNDLFFPLVPLLAMSQDTSLLENKRIHMLFDWLVQDYLVRNLKAQRHLADAVLVSRMPPIVTMTDLIAVTDVLCDIHRSSFYDVDMSASLPIGSPVELKYKSSGLYAVMIALYKTFLLFEDPVLATSRYNRIKSLILVLIKKLPEAEGLIKDDYVHQLNIASLHKVLLNMLVR